MYAAHDSQFVSKRTFVTWWWTWTLSLGVDYDSLFTCPVCSLRDPSETTWVIDGTALSLNAAKLPALQSVHAPVESKEKMPCRCPPLCRPRPS